jgi:hypothetical protein
VDAVAHVQNLRLQLQRVLLEAAERISGSEAMLAVNRANVQALLEVIHAYEAVIGRPPDLRTTAWNVLSSDDLRRLQQQVNEDRLEVLKALDASPASERPISLLTRQREIASWADALAKEQAQRASAPTRGPPDIEDRFTLREARTRFQGIDRAERQWRGTFDQHLAFQTELRLSANPGDASLTQLRRVAPLPRLAAPKPGVTRGPPTIPSVQADLELAAQHEFDATIARSPIDRAHVRARVRTSLGWLNAYGVPRQASSDWGADLLSVETLNRLKTNYADWQVALLQQASAVGDPTVQSEIREASQRLNQIQTELDRRAFGWLAEGLPTSEQPLTLRADRSRPGAIRTYELSTTRTQLLNELVLLQKEADNRPLTDVSLQRAIAKTSASLEAEDARLTGLVRSRLDQIEAAILQTGRGPEAAAEGHRMVQARGMLKAGRSPAEVLAFVGELRTALPATPRPVALRVLTQSHRTSAAAARSEVFEVPIPSNVPKTAITPAETDFARLFPRSERAADRWTRSYRGIIEDIRRAPGGVVVDTMLAASWNPRIQAARVDPVSGALTIKVADQWQPVEPAVDVETMRLAYAFVRDGRVVVADLRNINVLQSEQIARAIFRNGIPVNSDVGPFVELLASLTSVNIHPSLQDTTLALKMIAVDQLIFELLPDTPQPVRLSGSDTVLGINVATLRNLYWEDFHDLSDPDAWRGLFQKSILSAVGADLTRNADGWHADVDLRFGIYRLPPAKEQGPAMLLKRSTAWLQGQQARLQRLPVLAPLIQFAAATAIMRTVVEQGIENNFDELVGVPVVWKATPSLLCRTDGRNPCGLEKLQHAFAR